MAKKSNAQKAAEKAVKKSHPATLILAVLFLLIGAVAGVIVAREITKNDTFVLLGEKQVELENGASYTDAGVSIISFGRDISEKVHQQNNIIDRHCSRKDQRPEGVDQPQVAYGQIQRNQPGRKHHTEHKDPHIDVTALKQSGGLGQRICHQYR